MKRRIFVLVMSFAFMLMILGLFLSPTNSFAQDIQSTVAINNQSGEPVLVKLIGPTFRAVKVSNGLRRIVYVVAGEYNMLIRFGSEEKEYRYLKGDPFTIPQATSASSVITITLYQFVGRSNLRSSLSRSISAEEFEMATDKSK